MCNIGYLICFLICLIDFSLSVAIGCSNTCKLSPTDSVSNVGAIGIHEVDSVGVRYINACSNDLLQGEALGLLDTLFWERYSKRSTYHQWCALPTRRALVTHLPYTLPKCMLLDLPCDVICSVARFRLRAHTLRIKQWHGLTIPPLLQVVTCLMLMMCRMSNTSFSIAPMGNPSTRGLSPKDLCFPIPFPRLKQCACFSGPGKQ